MIKKKMEKKNIYLVQMSKIYKTKIKYKRIFKNKHKNFLEY